ncbi:MAG TPA: hypothetical protein VFJ01_12440, partial [Oleiagrimonas sp.]|nr:hypothetical protein [Oleiagrimonas sp.]
MAAHAAAPKTTSSHAPKVKPHQIPATKGMQIRGSVTLVAGSGQQLTPADQSSTLVYFVPKASST